MSILEDSKPILEFTGERYTPEIRGKIELEHIHRYSLASLFVKDKLVLDIASGEGYGSNILSNFAAKVIGVDNSSEAIEHAKQKYQKPNLMFRLGSCDKIPIASASVDIVVSFETIEHHDQHELMMKEIKRVLTPGGIVIISNPNKEEYTDKLNFNNPHHIKELYREEFKKLLSEYFTHMAFYGQRVMYGSAILREDGLSFTCTADCEEDIYKYSPGILRPLYLIAFASDSQIPPLTSSILEQPLEALQAMLTDWDAQRALFTKSLSWRMTKPLRIIERILDKGFKGFRT
jgi:ubiquinone/menaquinone biosynthesis C-methylase UbiE